MTRARFSPFLRGLACGALLLGALGAAAAAVPSSAQAQGGGRTRIGDPFRGERPLQLDLHAGFAWWHQGFATGARFGIPIVHNGFVPSINNAVYLNFGGDLYFFNYRRRGEDFNGVGLGLPVTLHWEFYFTEHWSAFGEVGLNFFFHPRYFDDNDFYFDGRDWFVVATGGRYAFNESVAITLRVGSPYLAFGVSFFF